LVGALSDLFGEPEKIFASFFALESLSSAVRTLSVFFIEVSWEIIGPFRAAFGRLDRSRAAQNLTEFL
jgi:hypothetical protein